MARAFLECPVCVGQTMERHSPDERQDVELDVCRRCGGMWFESGQVQRLRSGARIEVPGGDETAHAQRCHSCSAILSRDAAACGACDYPNLIDCPSCSRQLARQATQGVVLDACGSCRGVWFDRHEIAAVWTMALTAASVSGSGSDGLADLAAVDAGFSVIEVLAYTPDLGVAVVHGGAEAASFVAHGVAAAPELAGAAAEAAGSVFEILVEVVAAILSGLSG